MLARTDTNASPVLSLVGVILAGTLLTPSAAAQNAYDPPEDALRALRSDSAFATDSDFDLHFRPQDVDLTSDEDAPAARGFWDRTRKDGIPPVGVEHTQIAGHKQWRLEYRFELQSFDGLRDGRDDISTDDLFAASGYTVLPETMSWETHTLQGLYGIYDRWSLFLSVPFIRKEIDNVTVAGDSFSQKSSGIGDMEFGAIWDAYEGERSLLRADFGLSLPTGSFDESDNDENGNSMMLPYPMQLGSGSVALIPGATWMCQMQRWTWGVQGRTWVHLNKNADDWGVGDSFTFNAWASGMFTKSLVGTARIERNSWGDYHGRSEELDPDRNPLESKARQGGTRTDLLLGLAYELGDGYEHINRFELEAGVPIDEFLDGPALSTEWLFTFGWRYSF